MWRRKSQERQSRLLLAAAEGRDDEVVQLLESGISIHCRDDGGNTPLHRAAYGQHASTVALLLRHGADSRRTNKNGDSPLHHAVLSKSTAAAEALLESGCEIDPCNKQKNTPLHRAASSNRGASIKILIAYGADVNRTSLFGITPLHFAASNTPPTALLLLVEHGAIINAQDESGNTCVDTAEHQGATANVELLQSLLHWSRRAPFDFRPFAEPMIITILLCAKRRGLFLPPELWQKVFSQLQRHDFYPILKTVPKSTHRHPPRKGVFQIIKLGLHRAGRR
eukprot:m.95245 g.95245  ORF g.95245 m.95245 type:complete len:281 (+) comp8741_c0_seq2:143-985(+)